MGMEREKMDVTRRLKRQSKKGSKQIRMPMREVGKYPADSDVADVLCPSYRNVQSDAQRVDGSLLRMITRRVGA